MFIYMYIYRCICVYVTAGTDIAVTAISAPAGVLLPDGVRPRSARESLHRLGACTSRTCP